MAGFKEGALELKKRNSLAPSDIGHMKLLVNTNGDLYTVNETGVSALIQGGGSSDHKVLASPVDTVPGTLVEKLIGSDNIFITAVGATSATTLEFGTYGKIAVSDPVNDVGDIQATLEHKLVAGSGTLFEIVTDPTYGKQIKISLDGSGSGDIDWVSIINKPTASPTTSGVLTSADFNTFNNKQDEITTGTSAQYFKGDLTLGTFPTDLSSFSNGPQYVTSADLSIHDSELLSDHNAFGNKQGIGPEYYHLSNAQYQGLTSAGDTTLHTHSYDRNRANHVGTQTASTISDFATTVRTSVTATSPIAYTSATGAFSHSTTGTAGTYVKVVTNSYGHVTSGGPMTSADIPNLPWTKITSGKPTTLTGYGISSADTLFDSKYSTALHDHNGLYLTSTSALNPANISQDSNFRLVNDLEKAFWNGKVNYADLSAYAPAVHNHDGVYLGLHATADKASNVVITENSTANSNYPILWNGTPATGDVFITQSKLYFNPVTGNFNSVSISENGVALSSKYSLTDHNHTGTYQPAGDYSLNGHTHYQLTNSRVGVAIYNNDDALGMAAKNALGTSFFRMFNSPSAPRVSQYYATINMPETTIGNFTQYCIAFNGSEFFFGGGAGNSDSVGWKRVWMQDDFSGVDITHWNTAYSHSQTTGNPHGTTYSQVGAAAASHGHNQIEIESTTGWISTAFASKSNTDHNHNGTYQPVGDYSLNGHIHSILNVTDRQTQWLDANYDVGTAKLLRWKNYVGHTIFDASQGTAPDGSAHNNSNAEISWISTYPTLMGWNGTNTYGVRVDSARLSDYASNVEWNSVLNKPLTFPPSAHVHNQIEIVSSSGWISTAFASKSDSNHNHDSMYLGKTAKASDSDLLDGIDSSRFVFGSNGYATIDVGANFATINKSGFYNTNAATDSPVASTWAHVIHSNHSGDTNWAFQIAANFGTGTGNYEGYHVRTKTGGTYGAWRNIWTSLDFGASDITNWNTAYTHSQASHDYLPLTGGTLSGPISVNGQSLFYGDVSLDSSSYSNAALEISRISQNSSYFAGIGIHNFGVNAAYLYLTNSSGNGKFRYRRHTDADIGLWDTEDFTATNIANWNSAYAHSQTTGNPHGTTLGQIVGTPLFDVKSYLGNVADDWVWFGYTGIHTSSSRYAGFMASKVGDVIMSARLNAYGNLNAENGDSITETVARWDISGMNVLKNLVVNGNVYGANLAIGNWNTAYTHSQEPHDFLPRARTIGESDGYSFSYDETLNNGKLNLTLWDDNDGSEAFQILNNAGNLIAGFNSNRVSNLYSIQENGELLTSKYAFKSHGHNQIEIVSNTGWITDALNAKQNTLTFTPINKAGDNGIGNLQLGDNNRLILRKDTTPDTEAYTNASLVLETTDTDQPGTYHAGLGFHNRGVNAGFLHLSRVDGHLYLKPNTTSNWVMWDSGNFNPATKSDTNHRHDRLYRNDDPSAYYIRNYWTAGEWYGNAWRITSENDVGDSVTNIHKVVVNYADLANDSHNFGGQLPSYYQLAISGLTQTNWNNTFNNVHSHSNMGELNAIATGDIDKWNDVTGKVNASRIAQDTYAGTDTTTLKDKMLAFGNSFGRVNYAGTPSWFNYIMLRESLGTVYGVIGFSADGNWYSGTASTTHDITTYYKMWHNGNLTNLNQLVNGPGYISGNQTISLTGDATGSGTTSINVTNKYIDVNEHSTNAIWYPIVWDNGARQLFHTVSKLNFKPSTGSVSLAGNLDAGESVNAKVLRASMPVTGDGPGQGAHIALYDADGGKGWLLQHNVTDDRLSFMHLDGGAAWYSKVYFTQNGDIFANGSNVLTSANTDNYVKGDGVGLYGRRTTNINTFDQKLKSGFYDSNTPTTLSNWSHLLRTTHSDPTNAQGNWSFDIAATFGNGIGNGEHYYMRGNGAASWGTWRELWHSGNLIGNQGTTHTHDQYLQGNQSISLTGDASGSGTTSINVSNTKIDVNEHGTNNVWYPMVWDNGSRQLFHTSAKLNFNPALGAIGITGQLTADSGAFTNSVGASIATIGKYGANDDYAYFGKSGSNNSVGTQFCGFISNAFESYMGARAGNHIRLAIEGATIGDVTSSGLNVAGSITQNGTQVSLNGHTHSYQPIGDYSINGHTHNLLNNLGGTNDTRNIDTAYTDGSSQFASYIISNATGTNPFNTQPGNNHCKVLEMSHTDAGNWQHQISLDFFTDAMAFRRRNTSVWQPWRTLWHSGNLTPVSLTANNTWTGINTYTNTIYYDGSMIRRFNGSNYGLSIGESITFSYKYTVNDSWETFIGYDISEFYLRSNNNPLNIVGTAVSIRNSDTNPTTLIEAKNDLSGPYINMSSPRISMTGQIQNLEIKNSQYSIITLTSPTTATTSYYNYNYVNISDNAGTLRMPSASLNPGKWFVVFCRTNGAGVTFTSTSGGLITNWDGAWKGSSYTPPTSSFRCFIFRSNGEDWFISM